MAYLYAVGIGLALLAVAVPIVALALWLARVPDFTREGWPAASGMARK